MPVLSPGIEIVRLREVRDFCERLILCRTATCGHKAQGRFQSDSFILRVVWIIFGVTSASFRRPDLSITRRFVIRRLVEVGGTQDGIHESWPGERFGNSSGEIHDASGEVTQMGRAMSTNCRT